MRRFLHRRFLLAGAAVLTLVAAGIAVAGPGPASTTLVSATFSTGAPTNTNSHTCTGTNGDSITVTDGQFAGSASSGNTSLTGPLTIHVHSVYDSTTGVGTLSGDVRIQNSATPPGQFHAKLSAVDVNGTVQGWLSGHVAPGSGFMGSFTSTFSTTAGFGSGTIGSNGTPAPSNTAVITSGNCTPPNPPHPNGPKGNNTNGNGNDQGNNGPKHNHGH